MSDGPLFVVLLSHAPRGDCSSIYIVALLIELVLKFKPNSSLHPRPGAQRHTLPHTSMAETEILRFGAELKVEYLNDVGFF
jgi:hypothetical protein